MMKLLHVRPHFWFAIALLMSVCPILWSPTAAAQFTSPPGQGRPKGTAGGGTRPSQPFCLQNPNQPRSLVALAPTQAIGATASPNPTLWVYVPPTAATKLELSLFTQQQEGVYQSTMPIPASGWLSLPLLPQPAKLQPNQPYYWTVALICDPANRSRDWIVDGWIRHQAPSTQLQSVLTHASAPQQVNAYLQAGFWYEAFTVFLELQRTQPDHAELAGMWANLLKSAGLESIAMPTPQSRASR